MKCKNCGVDLVRGFTFCMECGLPVPDEALEESGLPPRNIDSGVAEAFGANDETGEAPAKPPVQQEEITELQPVLQGGSDFTQGEALKPKLQGGSDYTQGKALKPQYVSGLTDEDAGEALKAKYVGGNTDDEGVGKGADVQAVMREGSVDDDDNGTEKLTFCPNCGMHMQKNPAKCEICGMPLGSMPSVPKTSSGIPLFNTESDSFGGFGGFSGFGDFGGLSDEEAQRLDNFANPDPLFNDSTPTINGQATPDDFAQLTEQLASFSAGMPTLEVTRNTTVRQDSTAQGEDFQLKDFQLSDDLSDVAIPIYDNGVRVIGDFSLEEDPNETIPDPFAFLQTSLDEIAPAPSTMPELTPVQEPAPKAAPAQKSAPVQEAVPTQKPAPVQAFGETPAEEETPFIEEAPVISETPAPKPKQAVLSDIGEPVKPSAAPKAPKSPETPKAELLEPIAQSAPKAPQAPSTPTTPAAPKASSEPKAAAAPTTPQNAAETENKPQHAPRIPPNMKMCPACGRQMPNEDKFCPNCGRSMDISANSKKRGAKKKPVAFLIVLFILFLVAVAAYFFLNQDDASACEIFMGEVLQQFNE